MRKLSMYSNYSSFVPDETFIPPRPTPAPAPAKNPAWAEVEDDYFDSRRSRNDPEFDGDRW